MSFGVTPDGYVLKTLAEINTEAETALALVVDPSTGDSLQADLSDPTDLVSQIVAIVLEQVANGLLVDEAAYNQYNPLAATGDALSSVVVINGIRRQIESASIVDLDFTGTASVTIPIGLEVTNDIQSFIWETTEEFQFSVGGVATAIPAKCQTLGPISANAGTLTELVIANGDVTTIVNPLDAIPGQNEEGDSELRSRQQLSTETPAIGIPSGIGSAIRNLDDVTFAVVYNNIALTVDSNGVPPKTIAAVVQGGDSAEIAQVIFSRNGCAGYDGNTQVVVIDEQGFTNNIKFYRPDEIPIYIALTVTITGTDVFPADGEQQIIDAIIAYAAGGAPALGIDDGFDTTGFTPGADILVSRLYTPINSVPGHTINDVFIGLAPTPILSDDIPIDFNDVGQFEEANIDVTVITP